MALVKAAYRKGDITMTELQQEEKIKASFPEIRDTADNYAEAYEEAESGDTSAIDVEIDNMVWEVESEPADDTGREDAFSEQAYENNQEETDHCHERTGRRFADEYVEIPYARKVNKHIFTWVFSLVCGMYGVDRFVRGQIPLGIFKLMTFGGFGMWYLADLGVAIYKSYMEPDAAMQEDLHFDSYGRYV